VRSGRVELPQSYDHQNLNSGFGVVKAIVKGS
jgi:hypothetical protein